MQREIHGKETSGTRRFPFRVFSPGPRFAGGVLPRWARGEGGEPRRVRALCWGCALCLPWGCQSKADGGWRCGGEQGWHSVRAAGRTCRVCTLGTASSCLPEVLCRHTELSTRLPWTGAGNSSARPEPLCVVSGRDGQRVPASPAWCGHWWCSALGRARGCASSGAAAWLLPAARVLPRPLAAPITP